MFHFCHFLTSMNWHSLIDLSLSDRSKMKSLIVWFAFSWWIMILIIYLILPQSFLFHLLKILNVFLHTMSTELFMFWESSFVFFIYFRYGVLDIWMLTIFSHSLTWCFFPADNFLYHKECLFHVIPLIKCGS